MRGISVVLLIGCSLLLSSCARLAPEQPSTLMREVTTACVSQFPEMAVKDVTRSGLLVFEYGDPGQGYRNNFVACYRARVNQEIQALVAPGHLTSSVDPWAHIVIPIALQGDTMLMPVTLNHTQQILLAADHGASNTMLSPALLARMGVSVLPDACRWTVTFQGRQPLSNPLARVSSLAMGSLTLEELDAGISDAFPHVPGAEGRSQTRPA